MDYLFADEHNTHVFTDYRTLMFVYNPEKFEPVPGRHEKSQQMGSVSITVPI